MCVCVITLITSALCDYANNDGFSLYPFSFLFFFFFFGETNARAASVNCARKARFSESLVRMYVLYAYVYIYMYVYTDIHTYTHTYIYVIYTRISGVVYIEMNVCRGGGGGTTELSDTMHTFTYYVYSIVTPDNCTLTTHNLMVRSRKDIFVNMHAHKHTFVTTELHGNNDTMSSIANLFRFGVNERT